MENIHDLNEMRQQINELKQRIDRESTLNEQLLLDSLRMKMHSLRSTVLRVIIMGFVAIAIWSSIGAAWHLSIYFIIFTCLMLLCAIAAEFLINRIDDDCMMFNLTDTVSKLVRMKKLRVCQMITGLCILLLVWMPWLIYELKMQMDMNEFKSMVIGVSVGMVIGGFAGIRILLKMQRTNDEMIRQIEGFIK